MTTNKTKTSIRPFAIAAFAAIAFTTTAAGSGAETYKAKCVGCHGADGSGATAMGKKFNLRDLRAADVQKRSDEDLQEVITKGKPPMPGFGKTLDAAKVTELVAYIRSIAAK